MECVGHVITLVSNDIQKLDWLLVFWPYLLFGPLEAILVTVFVACVLGPAPAFAGMGCTLLIIPVQVSPVHHQLGFHSSLVF